MRRISFVILLFIHTSSFAINDYLSMEINSQGLGDIKIGMKPNEVSNILGVDITKSKKQYSEDECSSYIIGNLQYGGDIRFLVNKGIVSVISIHTWDIKTDKGININRSVKEIEKAYSGIIKPGKTHYGEIKLTVEYPKDKTKLIFIGDENRMRYMEVGKPPEIDYIEGCL